MRLIDLFRRPDYQSDTTQFIAQLKRENPAVEAGQRAGRALLWDKSVDREIWRDLRAGQVPQKPYVYQSGSN